MTPERVNIDDPRIQTAVHELQGMITRRYPDARFDVVRGDDPDGVYVWTEVDLDDPDPVIDIVLERMLELQEDERLPVYVIPVRTAERAAQVAAQARRRPRRVHTGTTATLSP